MLHPATVTPADESTMSTPKLLLPSPEADVPLASAERIVKSWMSCALVDPFARIAVAPPEMSVVLPLDRCHWLEASYPP